MVWEGTKGFEVDAGVRHAGRRGSRRAKSRSTCFSPATCALQTFPQSGGFSRESCFSSRPGTQLHRLGWLQTPGSSPALALCAMGLLASRFVILVLRKQRQEEGWDLELQSVQGYAESLHLKDNNKKTRQTLECSSIGRVIVCHARSHGFGPQHWANSTWWHMPVIPLVV